MQGHDILFDMEKKVVGFAESKCDYNYLISGTKSDEFEPFNMIWDIARFYIRHSCNTDKCHNFVILSFLLAHLILGALYIFLRMTGHPFGSLSSNVIIAVGSPLKSKNSEETSIMLELDDGDDDDE